MELNPRVTTYGHMDQFPYKRLQIIGLVEHQYYMSLSPELRYERWRGFYPFRFQLLFFLQSGNHAGHYRPGKALRQNDTSLRAVDDKVDRYDQLHLRELPAEEISMHAGLLEIYGSGVLLTGKWPSAGKSERAWI